MTHSIPSRGSSELAFRAGLAASAPCMATRAATLANWDQIKRLTVQVNRLDRWHLPGLLLIGDAAHAMSPVGGVGINLAVQDAVCAANRLTEALCGSAPIDEALLAGIQQIGRAHVLTPVTNAHLVCRLLLEKKK